MVYIYLNIIIFNIYYISSRCVKFDISSTLACDNDIPESVLFNLYKKN